MLIPRIPTDLDILNAIYHRYYEKYLSYDQNKNDRETKIYVPIDCQKIADDLNVDGDIVFIRLDSHLEKKHGYKRDDGSKVGFFALKIGKDCHCINFPFMASVLADLREKEERFFTTAIIAGLAVAISFISLLYSITP